MAFVPMLLVHTVSYLVHAGTNIASTCGSGTHEGEFHPWVPDGYKIPALYITNYIAPNHLCELDENTSPHQVNKYLCELLVYFSSCIVLFTLA